MLVGVLAVVVLVVAVLVLTYPDGSAVPEGAGGNANTGGTDLAVSDDGGSAARGLAAAAGFAQGEQANTFCRSYVYKRCNELIIGPSDCSGIADAGADVPPNLGLAGCRSVVDEILARVAGIPEENVVAAPAVGGVVVDVVEPDAEAATGNGDEQVQESEEETGTAQAGPAGAAGQPVEGPDPASVAAAMERIRQLETEIGFARNNYVGTNIGVQSRLDEMRAIAEEIGTAEAKEAYNAMLVKIGRVGPGSVGGSGGGGPVATQPSSPSGWVNVSTPVVAAPGSVGQAQVVTETAAPAPVVEVAPSSF